MRPLDPDDLDLCARAVASIGGDQPDDIRASLAWVIRNRLEWASAACGAIPDLARTCRDVLLEALGPRHGAAHSDLPNREWRRLYALNCLVWTGDLADQTGGAISCHRHDATKKWAKERVPTALLGPFIFYR
jgi:hypothetical protein